MEDPASYEDKHKNFDKLVNLQNDISRKLNEPYMGKTVELLVEGTSKNDPSKYTGRTRTGKVVNFSGTDGIIGKLVNVKINEIHSWFLNGEMVNEVK
jgi:tRNA-2-methylthio-N6-dimethylallyladenosine synthase